MNSISSIYSIESVDDIAKYTNNIIEGYLKPLDIIYNSIFDSTIGEVVGKKVIISTINFNKIKSYISPGDILYVNNKIISIETIGSNDITCEVIWDLFSGEQDYNLNNTFLYTIGEGFFDEHKNIFKLSNRQGYISKIKSVEFLDNNNIITNIVSNIDSTQDQNLNVLIIKIKLSNIDNNIINILRGFYLNIYLYSFDVVSNHFNINIKKEYGINSGIILDYNNNLIITPAYSYIIDSSDLIHYANKVNIKTSFERNINYYDKIILFMNISTNNNINMYKYNNIESTLFYKIIR